MRNKLLIISVLFLLSPGMISNIFAGTKYPKSRHLWLTYGHTKFIASPGIESALFFHKNVGFQLGINTYGRIVKEAQMANLLFKSNFSFYGFNIGPATEFKIKENHTLGGSVGFKIYYGPDYRFLKYYEEGGYNIYFDAANTLRPEYSVDFGLYYSYKMLSTLVKYDTARDNWRVGIGVRFEKQAKLIKRNKTKSQIGD